MVDTTGNVEEVRCEFKYSRAATAFLAAAALATLAIVAFVPYPGWVRGVGFVVVPAMAWLSHRRVAGTREIRLDSGRAIEVRDAKGWRSGTVRDGCFVAPWLTIVRWKPEGAWLDRTLVVLPDMVGADSHRRIRVILRWA